MAEPIRDGGTVDLPTPETVPWVAPVADAFTQPWWDACRARRLLVRRCASCGRAHFPPRPACPHCWSDDVTWEQVAGEGTVYSWSVVRENDLAPFSRAVPYAVAVIEVADGVRMMSTIVSTSTAQLAVGAPVEVVFVDRDDWTFPAWRVRA